VFFKDGTYAQKVRRGCVFQGRHVRAKGEEGKMGAASYLSR